MEKQTKESKAKGPKGKLISQRIIVLGGLFFIIGRLTRNYSESSQAYTLIYIGLALVLAGNLYRLYHFKAYKRYNILTLTAIAISAVIVLVIKNMQ